MNKNTRLSKFFRFAITFAVVSLALFLGLGLAAILEGELP